MAKGATKYPPFAEILVRTLAHRHLPRYVAAVPKERKRAAEDQRRVNVQMDAALHKRLAVMAALNDRSKGDEIRLMIEQGVERFEAKLAKAA